MMDTNNNILNGHITWALAAEGIQLKEVVHSETHTKGLKTYSRRKQPINSI